MTTADDHSYPFADIEADTQAAWRAADAFAVTEDPNREKFYCLAMFPYPSGNLHMGHVRNYAIADAIARYQRMLGKNVLQPMGWDAFGLPAENAAMDKGISPAQWTRDNIAKMKEQLLRLGFAYDWKRELATCAPSYYRWEQWFFTMLLKQGSAYRQSAVVNWDPVDQTVLANEQVVDGCGWRSGVPVERREIPQWFLKITRYADELTDDLDDKLAGWPASVRAMQRHWIGKSRGVRIRFPITDSDQSIDVYTTRPDTLMGASYLALAPEHPLALAQARHDPAVAALLEKTRHVAVAEEAMENLDKEGVPLSLCAVHPLTGESLPVWVANFVLISYGTGAVMSVPAHDQRDFEFARLYDLPIKQVIRPAQEEDCDISEHAYTRPGILIHSGPWDGLSSEEAFSAIADALQEKGMGELQWNYRLRDWGVSRQRYWGCPIPVTYDDDATPRAADKLPVILPEDLTPAHGSGSPLLRHPDFHPDADHGRRETDTFDTFVQSSWYYARFCCFDNDHAMLDKRADYWLPVDQYVGGIEHSVLHLLYARYWHKMLRDAGLVSCDEPFRRLLTQGMVLKDGTKMSKSRGNIVDPDELIERYGADTVRLYVLFAAPPEQHLEWTDRGVVGAWRFLNRLWRFTQSHAESDGPKTMNGMEWDAHERDLRYMIHKTIKKVTDDMERRYAFNTAIAAVMELLKALSSHPWEGDKAYALRQEGLEVAVRLLAPIAPHICDALWHRLGHEEMLIDVAWPQTDADAIIRDHMDMAVQINGKRRAQIQLAADSDEQAIREAALSDDNVRRHIGQAVIRRVIVIPGRVVNLVVEHSRK